MIEDDALTQNITLANCDQEPIHVPGAIQPHGLLAAFKANDLTISHISDNSAAILGVEPKGLLGAPVRSLFGLNTSEAQISSLLNVADPRPIYLFTVDLRGASHTFDAIAHRNGDVITVEFERSNHNPGFSAPQLYRLVQQAIVRLQGAHSVSDITRACAEHVRRISEFDRVMVYRFDEEWNGQVIAEDRRADVEPFLGLHYPASDIPRQARELYTRNWLRFIAHRDYKPSRVLELADGSHPPLDMSYSVLRSVSPIHLEYLRNMGVQASMSISLLREGRLWGLIACHHYAAPRYVAYDVRTACELLGQFMSLHIASAQDREWSGARRAAARATAEMLQNMEASEDVTQAVLEMQPDMLDLIESDGAAVVIDDRVTRIGQTPGEGHILRLAHWLSHNVSDGVYSNDRLPELFQEGLIGSVAAGVLAVSVSAARKIRMLWFRTEKVRTVDWAGDPSKSVSKGDGFARLSPRGSFTLWKETVKGRSIPWTPTDLEAAQSLHDGVMRLMLKRSAHLAAAHHDLRLASEEREKALDSERAARTEAERLNRVKDDFVATLSHELRTPLNAILGWAHILACRDGLDEDLTEGLSVIERNARSQNQMIGDLLDVSRIIAGKLRLDLQHTHLPTVIESAIETVSLAAVAKEIRIEKMLDPLIGMETTGDPGRLQQVVWNLLSNAVKFTVKGGKVQVVLERVESHVELSISDTGQGISPELLPYVFDRFRQGDSSASRKHGGLGLGLSIVRNLVELHGGTVRAESQGKGRGTRFVVCLPVRVIQRSQEKPPPEHPNAQSSPSDCERLNLAGVRVLVIDDEADGRELIKRILGECDCEATLASSTEEAFNMLISEAFDVIISDIGMPGQDGHTFMREWRKREQQLGRDRTPAIALTAYVRPEDRRRCIMAGFQAHLGKPVESGELLAQVASLAGRV